MNRLLIFLNIYLEDIFIFPEIGARVLGGILGGMGG